MDNLRERLVSVYFTRIRESTHKREMDFKEKVGDAEKCLECLRIRYLHWECEGNGVWVEAEAVILLPAVIVTFSSVSIAPDAIIKHPSIERVVVAHSLGYSSFREFVDLNAITESLILL